MIEIQIGKPLRHQYFKLLEPRPLLLALILPLQATLGLPQPRLERLFLPPALTGAACDIFTQRGGCLCQTPQPVVIRDDSVPGLTGAGSSPEPTRCVLRRSPGGGMWLCF